jgi:hypothetical protein
MATLGCPDPLDDDLRRLFDVQAIVREIAGLPGLAGSATLGAGECGIARRRRGALIGATARAASSGIRALLALPEGPARTAAAVRLADEIGHAIDRIIATGD